MIRKIVTALILVPLAIAFAMFAVANRESVSVSFDPFAPEHPAFALPVPLFALVLGLLIGGVMIGGVAAWVRQRKWRRAARQAQAEARELRMEIDRLRRASGEVVGPSAPPTYTPQLTIPPPTA